MMQAQMAEKKQWKQRFNQIWETVSVSMPAFYKEVHYGNGVRYDGDHGEAAFGSVQRPALGHEKS